MAKNKDYKPPLSPDVLQPANVQLATMIEHLRKLTDAAQKKNRADNESEKTVRSSSRGILDMVGKLKRGVAAATATATGAIGSMVATVTQTLGQFVSAFRPDVIQRFQLVVRDVMASVGEALLPTMQAVIPMFRWLGDTLNGIYRNVRPLIAQGLALLAPLVETVGGAIRQLVGVSLAAWMPVQEAMLAVFQQLVGPLGAVVGLVAQVGGAIIQFQAAIAGALVPVFTALVPLVKVVADVLGGFIPIVLLPFRALAAVVGPLVQMVLLPLTTTAKVLGAILQPWATVVKELGSAIGEVAGEITSLVGDVLGALVGMVQELIDAVGELLKPLRDLAMGLARWLVDAIRAVVSAIQDMVNWARELVGLSKITDMKDVKGDSFGKAANSPSFTSPEEMWKSVMKSTFGGGRPDPVAANTAETNVLLKWLPGELAKEVEKTTRNRQSGNSDSGVFMADPARRLQEQMQDQVRTQQLRGG